MIMDVTLKDYAWINKKDLPAGNLEELKRRLTVQPKRTHKKQDMPAPLLLYAETEDQFGIPRAYFMERHRLDHDIDVQLSNGHPVDLDFVGQLRPEQQSAVDDIECHWSSNGVGGIIQAGTGFGKTITALNLISRFRKSTLVIVNRTFLMDQWKSRILGTFDEQGKCVKAGFLPGARVGTIKGSKCEYGQGYDISIATIQTLSERKEKFPSDFWGAFGFVICDETHRISAPTWCHVAPQFTASYRLGVSATPSRKDGAEAAFLYHIGSIIHVSSVRRVVPSLRRQFTGFSIPRTRNFDPRRAGDEVVKRFIVKSPIRNQLIVEELCMAVKSGRKVLLLSERIKHLKILKEMFDRQCPQTSSSFYVGGMKKAELDAAESATVIFSTYQMTAEGFDVEVLDTIFLAMPRSDVKQAVGRIMRECKDKKTPIITDFIDEEIPQFNSMWNRRKEFYISEGIYNGA